MTPITFAHRGGAAHRPENTVEAFAHAKSLGAAGIESDVRLSADSQPVLIHNAVVRRGLRRHRVESSTVGELAEFGAPTLEEVYRAIGTDLEVSLDVKVSEAGPAAIEVARSVGSLERLWLCSPDLKVLADLRRVEPRVRLVHSTKRTAIADTLERHAARLADEGVDAFNLHRSEWSAGLVVLFHRFDVLAFAWDAQEVRHLREMLAYGVDAVYSDHVDRMVAAVGEWDPA